jgi:hypothetical protein
MRKNAHFTSGRRPGAARRDLRCAILIAAVLLASCSESKTDKLVTLCLEDVQRTKAECECQAAVLRKSMSKGDVDMLVRVGSVKTPEERMAVMREAGQNEDQFMAWGQSFQQAVEKASAECHI